MTRGAVNRCWSIIKIANSIKTDCDWIAAFRVWRRSKFDLLTASERRNVDGYRLHRSVLETIATITSVISAFVVDSLRACGLFVLEACQGNVAIDAWKARAAASFVLEACYFYSAEVEGRVAGTHLH